MYDMYPDWGPARHRETTDTLTRDPEPSPLQFLQTAFEVRDTDGERPDDN